MLKWCILTNGSGLLLLGALFVLPPSWVSVSILLTLYSVHALLVAPLLFLLAVFAAPRGTFRWKWPATDVAVARYRRLFWANLLVVAFMAGVALATGWGIGLWYGLVVLALTVRDLAYGIARELSLVK